MKPNRSSHLKTRGLALWLAIIFAIFSQLTFGQVNSDSGITEAEQAAFTRGQTLYNQGLYGEAIITLNEFLAQFPSSTIKDLSLLWLGRSYLAQGDIASAEKIGLRLKDIPDTPLATLYEEDLRVGRQSYAKAAAPKHSSKREVGRHQSAKAVEQPKPRESELLALTPMTKATEKPIAVQPIAPKLEAPTAKRPTPLVKLPESFPAKEPALTATKVETTKTNQVVVSLPKRVEEPKTVSPSRPLAVPVPSPKQEPVVKAEIANSGAPRLRSRFETSSGGPYRLLMVNDGDGRASDLTVRIEINPLVSYVGSDLLPIRQEMIGQRQVLTFRIPAVEAGETKALQISIRVWAGGSNPTTMPFKHSVFYKDTQGRFQHSP
ncbi:MAG TPA: tetratricopeptide repeat protein [Pyrinomonadaceae bacterium]|nr:tetratricopeptide repeat protein [Pyrinomonadaceae bacterium]